MSVLVYQAIHAVAAELSENGIAKRHGHEMGEYQYRSIEDVLNALAPLLARHKLCVLPRVLERQALRCDAGQASQLVTVRVTFDLVSALDGSTHEVQCFGEAIDNCDKGTAKAISSAYKSAMLQAFCIPIPEEDADSRSPRINGRSFNIALPEPPEGWESWATELTDIARSCDTSEAIDRLMSARRQALGALQRSRPDLYASIGEAIAGRLAELQGHEPRQRKIATGTPPKTHRRKRSREPADGTSASAEAA